MKFHYCGLHCGIQGDDLPPIFFLLMSLGLLVTAIESHEERILKPSGVLMCESHCRLTVGCSRHVFNPENLYCTCKVSLSVAKGTYCKSLRDCNKGTKLFSTRKGKVVCTLIRTKPEKSEFWNPSFKLGHLSKTSRLCKKHQIFVDNKGVIGYQFPNFTHHPNSIIYIKRIGVMILSTPDEFYHLRVTFKGSVLKDIKACRVLSTRVRGDAVEFRDGWRSSTIAEDHQTRFKLIFVTHMALAAFKKTFSTAPLDKISYRKADIGMEWVREVKMCVV